MLLEILLLALLLILKQQLIIFLRMYQIIYQNYFFFPQIFVEKNKLKSAVVLIHKSGNKKLINNIVQFSYSPTSQKY